jgi:hypothetical protein
VAPHADSGFHGLEDFCASGTLSGEVRYDGAEGADGLTSQVLDAEVHGLPPDTVVYVDWSNDHIRGYIIGDFKTGADGQPIPSSMHVSRLGEVRGVELVLESTSIPPVVLGRLEPC